MAAEDFDLEGSEHAHVRLPTRAHVAELRRLVDGNAALALVAPLTEISRDDLHTRYERLGRSGSEIAEELGVHPEQVWLALTFHDIPIRVGLADVLSPAFLRRHYVLAGETTAAIAERVGCSQQSVGKYLQRWGIPVRHGDDPALDVAELLAADVTGRGSASTDRRDQETGDGEHGPTDAGFGPGPGIGHLVSGTASAADFAAADGATPARLTPAYLLREYVKKGRSASSIAREWALTSAEVMRMVRDEGLPLHTVTPPPTPPAAPRAEELSREFLESRYLDQELSARRIGEEVGLSERAVLLRLHRLGIPLRPAGGGRSVQDRLQPDELRRRYVDEHQSITAIASDLEMSAESVRRALHRFGMVRPAAERASDVATVLTRDALEQAYVTDGLKLSEIAERFGVSAETVRRYAKQHGITLDRGRYGRRGGPLAEVLTAEVLRREYVEGGRSLSEIAAAYGFSSEGVRRQIHKVGIPLRPGRGGAAPAPKKPGRRSKLTAAVLQTRYIEQQQSIGEIAETLHVSPEGVRQALKRHGIELRTHRPARADLDPDLVRTRYVDERRTLHEIAEEMGVSTETVRREVHRLGIEIRRPTASVELSAELLREQYVTLGRSAAANAGEHHVSEQTVRRWLKRHDIAIRPAGGSPRHPDLGETLTAAYFQREYVLAGRTLADIAREHDVSTETVRRHARRHGVIADRGDDTGLADILPEAWLREHYLDEEWSLMQMAQNRGVSAETIRRYLRRYGIPLRPAGKRPVDGNHAAHAADAADLGDDARRDHAAGAPIDLVAEEADTGSDGGRAGTESDPDDQAIRAFLAGP